jgi:hypothetical protein
MVFPERAMAAFEVAFTCDLKAADEWIFMLCGESAFNKITC